MTQEQRLSHYGYEIRPDGQFWTFSPNGRGALHKTREQAVERAAGALSAELGRAEALLALKVREPISA